MSWSSPSLCNTTSSSTPFSSTPTFPWSPSPRASHCSPWVDYFSFCLFAWMCLFSYPDLALLFFLLGWLLGSPWATESASSNGRGDEPRRGDTRPLQGLHLASEVEGVRDLDRGCHRGWARICPAEAAGPYDRCPQDDPRGSLLSTFSRQVCFLLFLFFSSFSLFSFIHHLFSFIFFFLMTHLIGCSPLALVRVPWPLRGGGTLGNLRDSDRWGFGPTRRETRSGQLPSPPCLLDLVFNIGGKRNKCLLLNYHLLVLILLSANKGVARWSWRTTTTITTTTTATATATATATTDIEKTRHQWTPLLHLSTKVRSERRGLSHGVKTLD